MKIASKQPGLCVKSNYPKFKYKFPVADEPVEVDEDHVEKVLLNSNFYETNKSMKKKETKPKNVEKKKTWHDELCELKELNETTIHSIESSFPKKSDLLDALSNNKKLPFSDKTNKKLKEVFIH